MKTKLLMLLPLLFVAQISKGKDVDSIEVRTERLEKQVMTLDSIIKRLSAKVDLNDDKELIEKECRKYLIRHGIKNPKLGNNNVDFGKESPDYTAGLIYHYPEDSWTHGCKIYNKKFIKDGGSFAEFSLEDLQIANTEGALGAGCKK